MRKPKIQNRIGRSVETLPICALLALVLWWFPQQGYSHNYAISLFLTALTAYIIAETNNSNMLIRTRSRMPSSVWLFGAALIGLFHPFQPVILATCCIAVSHYLLFRTYQQAQPVADIFHTFFMLALGSLFFPPALFFAPFFLWYLLVFMRALSFRGFFAALVGLLLPFWFWTTWQLWRTDLTPIVSWWQELCEMSQPSLAGIDVRNYDLDFLISNAPFLLLCILALWTSVYYLRNSYDDKIRTRMMLYVYVFQSVLVVLFAFLTFRFQSATPLLLLCVAPLLAHYFTLRNTWLCLIMFVLSFMAFVALGLYTSNILHLPFME